MGRHAFSDEYEGAVPGQERETDEDFHRPGAPKGWTASMLSDTSLLRAVTRLVMVGTLAP